MAHAARDLRAAILVADSKNTNIMRWKFFTPDENPEEDRVRATVQARIDEWWEAFGARAMDLEGFFDNRAEWDLAGWMQQHLQAIDPRLMWEYGPGANRGHRLIITPEGEHHLRPLVDEIIARAPQLPGWLFFNHRTPEPVGHMARTVQARSGMEPAFTAVALAPGELNRIDLTFQFPAGFLDYQRPVAHTQTVIAAEALLGEDLLGDWLGKLDASARVAQPLSPSSLPRAFAALAGTQRAKLPAEPVLDFVDTLPRTTIELNPKLAEDYARRFDLRWAFTALPELWRNAHSDQRLWPGRFTRNAETFCYLKIDRGATESDPRTDHHVRFEAPLDGALRSRRYGCVIGAGTGLRYTYVDLALLDMEGAMRRLRKLLQHAGVSRRAWLHFFDSSLGAEWIGMWPDSPPPPMPWSG
jgi:hypothetical protein